MSLTKETRDYEILIRFNDEGKIGAHRQAITEVLDDGVVLSARLDAPQELNREQLQQLVSAIKESDWFVPPAPIEESTE